MKTSTLFRESWRMSAVLISAISTGMMHQPMLEELPSEYDTSGLNAYEYYYIAMITGHIVSSILMACGRKTAFLVATLPGTLRCFIVICTDQVNTVMMMTLSGLSTGCSIVIGTVIIGEYTSPKYRQVLLNLVTTSLAFGSTISLLFDNYYKHIVLSALFLQTTSFGLVILWPESPYFPASNDQKERGRKFVWMTNSTCKKEPVDVNQSLYAVDLIKKYTSSKFLRPITVIVFAVILMKSSEVYSLVELDYNVTDKLHASALVLISSIITLMLVSFIGHRKLLILSGCIVALFMFLYSFYVFLIHNNFIGNNNYWLDYLFPILHLIFSNLGTTSIPLALIGELFPMKYKTVGCLVSGCLIYGTSWAILKSKPSLITALQLQGILIVFGGFMIISLLVLWFILPETKNKSLLGIEDQFNNESCKNDETVDRRLVNTTIPLLL